MKSTVYLQLMFLCQVVLSGWGAYQSYIAITNLRKYEETTKKLAKWSSEVENQLNKTRTTQASGAIAVCTQSLHVALALLMKVSQMLASLISSVVLSVAGASLPSLVRYTLGPIMLLAVLVARNHIKGYWAPNDGKTVGTRVPLPNMEDYNEAQRRTEELLQTLEYLEYGWAASSFVAGFLRT